jgi:DNA-binding transcriptional ArsR family regulator
MSINSHVPDYELAERIEVTGTAQLRALAHPVRVTILDLLLERAASVAELAAAVDRPKSTVAYHVGMLVDAGMLRVVRTRRVRAIDERYYGRTARLFAVGVVDRPADVTPPPWDNDLTVAAAESAAAHESDRLRSGLRHARIPEEVAAAFWEGVVRLVQEYTQLPRSGETVFGFAVALYPTEHPTLPDAGSSHSTGDSPDSSGPGTTSG